MMTILEPTTNDIISIETILSQWTDSEEVKKYIERINNEIKGKVEFNSHYWVAKEGEQCLGVAGLSDPLPKTLPFKETDNPVEIKILYVDGKFHGKGVGKALVEFLENEAKKNGNKEVLVRSAKRYEFSAWGFYKKMGYKEVGELTENETQPMQVFNKIISKM